MNSECPRCKSRNNHDLTRVKPGINFDRVCEDCGLRWVCAKSTPPNEFFTLVDIEAEVLHTLEHALQWHDMDDEPYKDEAVLVAFEDSEGKIYYKAAIYRIREAWNDRYFVDADGCNLIDDEVEHYGTMVGWQKISPFRKGK
jgi:hypothetical protein